MAISANSYGSVDEVLALTRHLLRDSSSFNEITTPTLAEVEAMIDRVSGTLNSAIAAAGFTVPISQADAKKACDDWVVAYAVRWVEMSHPGRGWRGDEGVRTAGFTRMHEKARKFVASNAPGWKYLGVDVSTASSDGLQYTGLKKHDERTDPDSTTREQPAFRRRKFDR